MSLVLFDIDGTILLTHGEGMRAMQDAGRELYHPQFSIDGVDFSGRLDSLIWRQLCEMNGVCPNGDVRSLAEPDGDARRPAGPDRGAPRPAQPNGDASCPAQPNGDVRRPAGPDDTVRDSEMAGLAGLKASPDAHTRFRRAYERHLRRRLDNGARVTLLPGVRELLDELRTRKGMTLGLVTGNYPETGQLKIDRAGIDFSMFTVFGWGCDGGHRRDLPARAIQHCREVHAREVQPRETIIIGDTPHDIDCARHNGCRSIGVATGAFSMEELRAHEADLVVADLTDTAALCAFISGQS